MGTSYKIVETVGDTKQKEDVLKSLEALKGLIIKGIRYMDKEEAEKLDFFYVPIVIELEDGTILWPTMDNEGTDGGGMQIQIGDGSKNMGVPDVAPALPVKWEEEERVPFN